jgi:hypothetical protein
MMYLSVFQDYIVKALKDAGSKNGGVDRLPPFISIITESNGMLNFELSFFEKMSFEKSITKMKEGLKLNLQKIEIHNSKLPPKDRSEIVMAASGMQSYLTLRDPLGEGEDSLEISKFEESRPSVVMVIENKLITKLVAFPIVNGMIEEEDLFEEQMLNGDFLCAGVLRDIQPCLN